MNHVTITDIIFSNTESNDFELISNFAAETENQPNSSNNQPSTSFSTPNREGPPPSKKYRYAGDFDVAKDFSPRSGKKCIMVMKTTIEKQRSKIKMLKQSERRLKQRIKSYEEIIDDLKKKGFISENGSTTLQVQ